MLVVIPLGTAAALALGLILAGSTVQVEGGVGPSQRLIASRTKIAPAILPAPPAANSVGIEEHSSLDVHYTIKQG